MKVAIVGASGKTGRELVRAGLERGDRVVAVCRASSAGKLDEFVGQEGVTVVGARSVSDQAALTGALAGCDAAVAILLSVRDLKATDLVTALAATGVSRVVFTAGEVTAEREPGERYTVRQRIMRALIPPITRLTPYSVTDMLQASVRVRAHPDWAWTIVRAPTLDDGPPSGYRLCRISEVRSSHVLSRADYASCLLDTVGNAEYHNRTLTVVPAGSA